MKLKLGLLHLSERIRWKNWPTWLKGIFLFWPSLGPAYLFITRTPIPTDGTGEIETILANLEYQNYFIVVFLGLWSINLVVLGIVWIIGGLISHTYRDHLSKRTSIPVKKIIRDIKRRNTIYGNRVRAYKNNPKQLRVLKKKKDEVDE